MTTPGDQPGWQSKMPILDLRENWTDLSAEQRVRAFYRLDQGDADDFFLSLGSDEQVELIIHLPQEHKRHWLRLLAPDDLADLLQEVEAERREHLMAALDPITRHEVTALLAYEEDEAGGLMNPRFARVRPDMSVDEALKYLRRQAERRLETMRYIYVLGPEQRLLGVVSLRQLFMAPSQSKVSDIMRTNLICADENLDQEELSQIFSRSALNAVPIIDEEYRMKGIVTVDDIVEVVEEEATEDIQRLGGTEVLDAPYLKVHLLHMIKKRAGWLVILFLGEMLTATAMAHYQNEIASAVVLALFIPLIISSGGNSGSQASTLVVRAMALGEVQMRDWFRIFGREIIVGLSLGAILGAIGLLRIIFWPTRVAVYGEHYQLIGIAVACSLVGVVLWGSLVGSMLPFALRKCRLDPAVASAPFVATLVDVFGLVIYFTVASIILHGTLL